MLIVIIITIIITLMVIAIMIITIMIMIKITASLVVVLIKALPILEAVITIEEKVRLFSESRSKLHLDLIPRMLVIVII